MKPLYAIRAFGGSYDDAWEKVQFVTDDLEKAEAYCVKMNALRDKLETKNKEINKWFADWLVANPAPECEKAVEKKVPRWDSKTKVTVEMRAERKRIEDENRVAHQASMKPYYDWDTRGYDEWVTWQEATYSAEVLKGLREQLHDTYWDTEPVEWLE